MKKNTKVSKSVVTMRKSSLFLTMALATGFSMTANAATVENYGEDLTQLKTAFSQSSVHILQIGDSHTAGDYFTEQLRKRLQTEIGDGGVGFAYASKLSGQRNARHGYRSNWKTSSSRSDRHGGSYPIGGVYASPTHSLSKLTLTSQYYANGRQDADVVVFGSAGQKLTLNNSLGLSNIYLKKDGWQSIPASIKFPTSIQASPNMKIGGFWLRKSNSVTNTNSGGIVSSMGINGATQDYWKRWHTDLSQGLSFSKANLVILAYGTNEAFRNNASNLTTEMNKAIKNIRQGLPNASILIVGAPESLKKTAGRCGSRATSLDSVQQQLKQVAQANRTLYWSWEDAMGGQCSMKSWVNKGLAAKDGVHFSRRGYNKAANDLYSNLKVALNKTSFSNSKESQNFSASPSNSLQNSKIGEIFTSTEYMNNSTVNIIYSDATDVSEKNSNTYHNEPTSKGQICDSSGNCVNF